MQQDLSAPAQRRRTLARLLAGGAALALAPAAARAQNYDDLKGKLVRIVVPFPAGMGSDNIARVVAQSVTDLSGANVIVENKPGGNNVIAVKYLNSLKHDGLAWFLASQSPLAVNAVLYKSLGYDPVKDLRPIALMMRTRWVVVAAGNAPFRSFADLVATARQSGDIVTASAGSSGYQLGLQLVANAAGFRANVVPYTGTPQALNDVIGGQVALSLVDVSTPKPLIESGRLKPVLVIGERRFAGYPDAPSSGELKLSMPALSSWNGIYTTGQTPTDIRLRMAELVRAVVASAPMQDYFTRQGSEADFAGVDAMQALQMDQIALYRRAMEIGGVEMQ